MHRLLESEAMKRLIISLITASVLSACTLAPHYRRPESPVPDRWPSDTAAANTTGSVDVSASGQPSRPGIGDPSSPVEEIERCTRRHRPCCIEKSAAVIHSWETHHARKTDCSADMQLIRWIHTRVCRPRADIPIEACLIMAALCAGRYWRAHHELWESYYLAHEILKHHRR